MVKTRIQIIVIKNYEPKHLFIFLICINYEYLILNYNHISRPIIHCFFILQQYQLLTSMATDLLTNY